MKNVMYRDGSFGLLLPSESLEKIKRGEVLETKLFREEGEDLGVPIEVSFSENGYFDDGFLRIEANNVAFSKSDKIKIYLSEKCIRDLEDLFRGERTGIVSTSYRSKRIIVYSELFENFDILYRYIEN